MVAMHVESLLCDLGYDVTIASSVEDALVQASSGQFHWALLDVNLRGRQSFVVADALCDRGIPFAFATGYGAEGVDPRFAGTPVLQKPFTQSDLRQVLSLIGGR